MDISAKGLLENLIFIGNVSSLNPAQGTVRVTRPDKGDKVTSDMAVLQRGTKDSKDYWMPAVGDQVLCMQLPNFSGSGVGDGFVIGAFYSTVDGVPGGANATTRVLNHPGNVTMNIGGTLTIHAGTLDIVGGGDVVASGISLTKHVHGGVESGGGTTSGPK
nr:MAG TPA_asm: baseplate assembly protein [Caudoviricetes sp.]